MKKALFKSICLLCIMSLLACVFSGCKPGSDNSVSDIITAATEVYVNGVLTDTVEARMGAFQGKQGDYIEFKFDQPWMFNTVFINEKTATIRQYNIYAEIDGKYTLVHTGKNVFQENIIVDPVMVTGFKLEIVNTAIGDDNFVIQGISAYYISQNTPEE